MLTFEPNARVRAHALALTGGDQVRADDLVQEAWIAAWQSDQEFENPNAWMSRYITIKWKDDRKIAARDRKEWELRAPLVEPTWGEPTFLLPAEPDKVVALNGRTILHGESYMESIRAKRRARDAAKRQAQ